MVFLQKICLGLAVYLVLQRLGAAGYIKPTPDVLMPIQPNTVLDVIRSFIGPLPAIALILGLVLTYFYPITREMHAQIMLKLKEREENRGS